MIARLLLVAAVLACGCGGAPRTNFDGGDAAAGSEDASSDGKDSAPEADRDTPPLDASDAALPADADDAAPQRDAAADAAQTPDADDAATPTDADDVAPQRDAAADAMADAADAGQTPDATGADARDAPSDTTGDGLTLVITVDKAVANGWSMIPVAMRGGGGQVPPGTELTFSLSRTGAGILRPRVLIAGGPEPQLYFTPCDGVATPTCLGPVTIRVGRSSAPEVVLAESRVVMLTTDPDVGSPAACLDGGNALFLDGTSRDALFGISLVREGTFDPAGAARQRIKLGVNPVGVPKPTYGAHWNIELSSTATMTDLATGIYRKSAGATQTFTITRTGISSGCSAGDFQIFDLAWAGNQLERFLATFDLACSPIGSTLRGCVRFSAP